MQTSDANPQEVKRQPGFALDLIKKAALMGTCAAGAVAAGLVSSDLKQASAGGVVTGICGITAALGAGIALLTDGPLDAPDHRRRRTRIAAITKPLDPAASESLRDHHDDTAMLASTMIQMQQMSMEAEAEHLEGDLHHHHSAPSSPRTTSSDHAEDMELLNSYSRHFPEDLQLDQAPTHILRAHQRLETMIDQMSYEDLCEHFGSDGHHQSPHCRPEVKDVVSALPSSILMSSSSKGGAGGSSSSSGGSGNFTEASCPICLEDFEEGDEVRLLPRCCHCFHVACVDHWLLDHKENCPVCRCGI